MKIWKMYHGICLMNQKNRYVQECILHFDFQLLLSGKLFEKRNN